MFPHLDAAYNLARWLTRNEEDAQDVVQEAYLRALRFFDSFRGGNSRAWLLKIVRNTCYTRLQKDRVQQSEISFDEPAHTDEEDVFKPEAMLLQIANSQLIHRALKELPLKFREMLLLRELEGFSYKEIAEVVGIPIGTVMSGLARSRERLRRSITSLMNQSSVAGSAQTTLADASSCGPR